MDLKQLKHFVAAADTESFSKGAERAFVSQPALSASISKLEAELGTPLFTRNKRGVALTSAGKRLLLTARPVLSECARVKNDLRQSRSQETIRVGLISTVAIQLVAKLIEQFRDECPDVFLEIVDGTSLEIAKYLEEGRLDVAFTTTPSVDGANGHGGMALFTEPFVLMIPLEHHLKGRRSAVLGDLNGEPFIARIHCEYRDIIIDIMKKLEIRPRLAFRTTQDYRALALVQAGLGVALVPRHYQAEGTLKLPLTDMLLSRTVGLWWQPRSDKPAVDRFVAFAKAAVWP